jgi:hypothetical protein
MFLRASRRPLLTCAALTLLALAGCGGGGSGSNDNVGSVDPINPPPVQPPPPVEPPVEPPPDPTDGTALLSWLAPTQREDGTPLTDLAGFHIFYGQDPQNLDTVIELTNPGLSSYLIEYLGLGTWYFTMTAFDDEGRESARSEMASKTIT